MDEKLKAMALRAIAKETPLKGYKLGVLDAAIREETGELVVILLDGRKMIYSIKEINMRAATPATKMINHQTVPTARTVKNSGGRSKKPN